MKYGKARRYIAVSEFVKGVLMQGGVSEDKISVVYDGVPVLEVAQGTGVFRWRCCGWKRARRRRTWSARSRARP